MNIVRLCLIVLSFWALIACASPDTSTKNISTTLPKGIQHFVLNNDDLDEVSGLARSHWRDDLLWVHNDSGSGADLFAIDTQGRYQGQLSVQNALAKDWEDLASFSQNGQNFLIIADVGDNRAQRSVVSLYIIAEPDTRNKGTPTAPFSLNTRVVRQIDFQYQDGARDVESLAVDVAKQQILLLSKRNTPPRLYQLPLQPPAGVLQTAKFVAEITSITPPNQKNTYRYPRFGSLSNQPTAMDISPDGQELLIVTYKDSYRYSRAPTQSWATALSKQPILVDVPQLLQAEAGGYSHDGQQLYIASEQLPAALVMIPVAP